MAAEVTPREGEVLAALRERLTNAEIAAQLHLSERTVESHVSSLLRKLGLTNRLELAAAAKQQSPLPAPLALLSDPVTYVGRRAERDALAALWERARRGQVLGAVLTAEAGMGKSRLVAELARTVHADGAQVLLGACHEGAAVPFEPFDQLLAADVDTLPETEVQRRRGRHGDVLGGAAADTMLDPASSRADVLAGLHGYLTRAASLPTLLVLEDVHWGSASTLDAVRHLLEVGGSAPLLVVVTARDVPPQATALLLADLDRLPGVERIPLHGLGAGEVAELVGHLGGDEDPAEVMAQTDGNPLLVREVAGAGTRGSSLPGLLLRRYATLDAEALDALDVAAVLGAHFDPAQLARVLQRPLPSVLASLEAAAASGLLVHEQDQWQFAHALFRTARYDGQPASRRVQLHRSVAERLGDRLPLQVLAHHALTGHATNAVVVAERAAAEAEQSLAFAEAADLYRRALDLAEDRLPLLTRLGELLQAAGDPGYRDVLLRAAAAAREAGDAEALARVGWAMVRYGGPGKRGRVVDELGSITEEALRAIGPAPTAARARTLAVAAEELCFFDATRSAVLAEEARNLALELDDPVTLGHVLLSYRIAGRTPDNDVARLPTADALVEISVRTGQPTFAILGHSTRAWSLREQGRLAEADAAMDHAISLRGDRVLPPTYLAAVAMYQASRASLAGDLDGGEAHAESVFALTGDGYDPANWYGPAIVMLRHARGRLPELLPLLEGASRQAGIDVVYRTALAVAMCHADRREEARLLVDELVSPGLPRVPWNFTWLACLVALAEAVELTGSREAAVIVGRALLPYAGRLADLPQAVVAPVDLALAQLALGAGDNAAAAAHARRGIAASRERGTPVFLARELLRLAAATGDRAALEEALQLGEDTGADLIAQEASRLVL